MKNFHFCSRFRLWTTVKVESFVINCAIINIGIRQTLRIRIKDRQKLRDRLYVKGR